MNLDSTMEQYVVTTTGPENCMYCEGSTLALLIGFTVYCIISPTIYLQIMTNLAEQPLLGH